MNYSSSPVLPPVAPHVCLFYTYPKDGEARVWSPTELHQTQLYLSHILGRTLKAISVSREKAMGSANKTIWVGLSENALEELSDYHNLIITLLVNKKIF